MRRHSLASQIRVSVTLLLLLTTQAFSPARAAPAQDARNTGNDPLPVLATGPAATQQTTSNSGDDIAIGADGNIYMSGSSFAEWGEPVRAYSGSWDVFVLKLDPSGNTLWSTFLGGAGIEEGSSIAVDGNGSIYVAGSSTAAWGCSPNPCTISPYRNGSFYIAKLDASGQLLWNTFMGGNGYWPDSAGGITAYGAGTLYIVGQSDAAWGCSPVPCTIQPYSSDNTAFLARLNSSGALVWNTFGPGFAAPIVDGSGNVYALGSGGVVKIDSSGSAVWSAALGHGEGSYAYNSVDVDQTGNVYVAGWSRVTWGDPVSPFDSVDGDWGDNASVVKLDASGNLMWNTFLGEAALGPDDDLASGIIVDASGHIYITGFSDLPWSCSPSSCTVRPATVGDMPSPFASDTFVAQLDGSGHLVWNTFLGETWGWTSVAGRPVLDEDGNLYVVGSSTGPWSCSPLDCTLRKFTLHTSSFAAKVSGSGALVWNTFQGAGMSCTSRTITVTNNLNSGTGSLRQALTDACPGGTVNFAAALSGETITPLTTYRIDRNLTVDGSSLAQHIQLDGSIPSDSVISIEPEISPTVVLKSLDISNAPAFGVVDHSSGALTIEDGVFSSNGTAVNGTNLGSLRITHSSFVLNHIGVVSLRDSQISQSTFMQNDIGVYNERLAYVPPEDSTGGALGIELSLFDGNLDGAVQNRQGSLGIFQDTFRDNERQGAAGGAAIDNQGVVNINTANFESNQAPGDGGAILNTGTLTIGSATFSRNHATNGGAIFSLGGLGVSESTFNENSADSFGGAIHAGSGLILANSTLQGNTAQHGGAIYYDTAIPASTVKIQNNTVAGNASGLWFAHGQLQLHNNILAGSTTGADCSMASGTLLAAGHNIIQYPAAEPNGCGTPLFIGDPLLGPLADRGGATRVMVPLIGSRAIDAGDDAVCSAPDSVSNHDQLGMPRPVDGDGDGIAVCDIGAYEAVPTATVSIGGTPRGSYFIESQGRVTPTYLLQGGPVHVQGTESLISSERVHNANGFINEAMGVPASELTTEYWYPWYDNLGMASWILVGNPSTTDDAHVTINIAGTDYGPYTLIPGEVKAQTYPIMNGPVHVTSDINVFSSERVATGQGFVQETMGYPNNQLTNEYWFPWYDNLGMMAWILVGNPSPDTDAHVTITIAGAEVDGSPFIIPHGGRITPRFPIMNGPVHITSDINVFTSERVHGGYGFVQETMGYPANKLSAEYWFPWYDNLGMMAWILVGNPSSTDDAHVTINIAGTDYGPYTIDPGSRITPRFPVMNGPVHVTSDINVFTSERVHTGQGFVQETMGFANNRLSTEYWYPWYDNLTMMEWVLVGKP